MDPEALAMQLQFQLYREQLEEDDGALPFKDAGGGSSEEEEEEEEEDDIVAVLPSEAQVRRELDDMMKAMKFRLYYGEDDPRGDLSRSTWDDEKKKELDKEKRRSVEEVQHMPLYRLIKAAQKGQLEEVKSIVENTDVNVNSEMQFHTPLGMAVFVEAEEVVEFLLTVGANPNGLCATTESIMEQHPLMIAVQKRNYEIARHLLLAGANPNWQDTARLFPLF